MLLTLKIVCVNVIFDYIIIVTKGAVVIDDNVASCLLCIYFFHMGDVYNKEGHFHR